MSAEFNNKLDKRFILRNRSDIQQIFNNGEIVNYEYLKVIFSIDNQNLQKGLFLFVSVPKRQIHKAYKRNLLKRRIKEAFRLNTHNLKRIAIENNLNIKIAIVYSTQIMCDYKTIENKIIVSLQNISSKILE